MSSPKPRLLSAPGTKSRPVGIFDSGVGGLTVVYNLQRQFPGLPLVYFGDTARLPYGNKSARTVRRFAKEDTRFLLRFHPQLIVVACHTASALALAVLRREFSLPVVGVLSAGVRAALRETTAGRVGVIGTVATIKSGAYERQIKKQQPAVRVFPVACPLFVPLVEEGFLAGPITRQAVRHYLTPLKQKKIDTLILACTHYPLLKEAIADFMGPGVKLVDPSVEVVSEVSVLIKKETVRWSHERRAVKIYLSDVTASFQEVASRFLGGPAPVIKRCSVGVDTV